MINSRQYDNKIYSMSTFILYVARIFGVLPMRIARTNSNTSLQVSKFYMICSGILGIILVTMQCFALPKVTKSVTGENNIPTSIYSYTVISTARIIVTVILYANSFINVATLQSFYSKISECDEILNFSETKKKVWRDAVKLVIRFGGSAAFLTADAWITQSLAINSETSPGIFNWLCYQIPYLITFVYVQLYFQLVSDVTIRFQRVSTVTINRRWCVRSQVLPEGNARDQQEPQGQQDLFPFIECYFQLCDAVEAINRGFGLALLVILIQCILNLTVASYHAIVLLSRCLTPLIALLMMRFLFHLTYFLLIVEPCHVCLEKAKQSRNKILESVSFNNSSSTEKKVQLFYLHNPKLKFSAFGLVDITRGLVASVASSLTTYLVILLQFRQS